MEWGPDCQAEEDGNSQNHSPERKDRLPAIELSVKCREPVNRHRRPHIDAGIEKA